MTDGTDCGCGMGDGCQWDGNFVPPLDTDLQKLYIGTMTTDTQTNTVALTDEQKNAIDKAADILAPIFEANGWTYFWSAPAVPNRDQIASTITELVHSLLADEDIEWTSTGRITVLRTRDFDEVKPFDVEIKLDLGYFTVEE